tara:strand:+ start:479 stop:646 length:168 start_codon:yes stop_codon:yes gene_type:complete
MASCGNCSDNLVIEWAPIMALDADTNTSPNPDSLAKKLKRKTPTMAGIRITPTLG